MLLKLVNIESFNFIQKNMPYQQTSVAYWIANDVELIRLALPLYRQIEPNTLNKMIAYGDGINTSVAFWLAYYSMFNQLEELLEIIQPDTLFQKVIINEQSSGWSVAHFLLRNMIYPHHQNYVQLLSQSETNEFNEPTFLKK